MKSYPIIFIALLLPIFFACKKENSDEDLAGTWKLIEVHDKSTHTTIQPPASSVKSVIITFTGDGGFYGNTLFNLFTAGEYTVPASNKIIFTNFISTLVAEGEWGGSFMTVLNACMLQSYSPCHPSTFSIEGRKLKIFTPLRYDVTLQRL